MGAVSSERELAQLLLDSLATGHPPDERSVAALLADVASSEITALNVYAWQRRHARVAIWPTAEAQPRMEHMTARVGLTHPLIAHFVRTDDLRVLQPGDVDARWHHSPLRSLLREELSIEHHVGLPISRRHGTLSSFALGRSGAPFSAHELEGLRRAQRLLQAYDRARSRFAGDPSPLVAPAGLSTAPDPRLTAREADIVERLESGQDRRHVARDLGVSVRTVDKHVEHINAKLGTRSLLQSIATLRLPRQETDRRSLGQATASTPDRIR